MRSVEAVQSLGSVPTTPTPGHQFDRIARTQFATYFLLYALAPTRSVAVMKLFGVRQRVRAFSPSLFPSNVMQTLIVVRVPHATTIGRWRARIIKKMPPPHVSAINWRTSVPAFLGTCLMRKIVFFFFVVNKHRATVSRSDDVDDDAERDAPTRSRAPLPRCNLIRITAHAATANFKSKRVFNSNWGGLNNTG